MEKIRVDVTGLTHGDLRDRWQEYAAEAVGRELVLQPQPENLKDPYAVRVREGSVHVGYVAATDLGVVHQALKGSGRQRLRGVVVECVKGHAVPDDMTEGICEPTVLCVEVEVERVAWDYEPFDDSVYAAWHYDGLSLMPRRLEQLGDTMVDLVEELETDPTICPSGSRLSDLLKTNLYDPSREMVGMRYRLERLLAERQEPELREAAERLRWQKGLLVRHDCRDKVARYLFLDLPRHLQRKGLEQSHYTYDNRLAELEEQLRQFPYQLYDKFLADPVDFLREVYYKHVPRRHLFPLLSGIVLMILKGRVNILRWGRNGDTEPIRQIEEMRTASLTDEERERSIRQSLEELLKMKDTEGNPIIGYKNQWAAIMGVLVGEYRVTECDMRAFCRKMDEWGFGSGSGHAIPCDYESLSKSSEYAQRPFHQWRGGGTAHQRQVLAATTLRQILRPRIGYK